MVYGLSRPFPRVASEALIGWAICPNGKVNSMQGYAKTRSAYSLYVMKHDAEKREPDHTALSESHVQSVRLTRVSNFHCHPSRVLERLQEFVHSALDTQSLHLVWELGVPDCVESSLNVKGGSDSRTAAC